MQRPRFPLFYKIIAGFAAVILIMVGLSFTTLLQLRPLGTDHKPESGISPLAVSAETLWKIEQDAARTYAGAASGPT